MQGETLPERRRPQRRIGRATPARPRRTRCPCCPVQPGQARRQLWRELASHARVAEAGHHLHPSRCCHRPQLAPQQPEAAAAAAVVRQTEAAAVASALRVAAAAKPPSVLHLGVAAAAAEADPCRRPCRPADARRQQTAADGERERRQSSRSRDSGQPPRTPTAPTIRAHVHTSTCEVCTRHSAISSGVVMCDGVCAVSYHIGPVSAVAE